MKRFWDQLSEAVATYYIPFLEIANICEQIKGCGKFCSKETCLPWFNTAFFKVYLTTEPY